MKQLPKFLIGLGGVCVVIAGIIWLAGAANPLPGVVTNWVRAAEICVLFSIALSLLGIKEK